MSRKALDPYTARERAFAYLLNRALLSYLYPLSFSYIQSQFCFQRREKAWTKRMRGMAEWYMKFKAGKRAGDER